MFLRHRAARLAGYVVVAAVSFLFVVGHRWSQMGTNPSGIDQGHWLAFGRAYWGEGNSSLSDLFPISIMPPLIPTLMAAGTSLFGPETASRVLAVGSILAVMTATFLLTRRVAHQLVATAAAVLVGLSATIVEPAAWGGYPQNVALAAMIIAVYCASGYLSRPSGQSLLIYSLALFVVASSHHAYFGITSASVVVVCGLWSLARPGWGASKNRVAALVLASVPSLALFAFVAWSLVRAHYDPAIDASGSSLAGALRFAFPTVRWLWVVIGAVGFLGFTSHGFWRFNAVEWRSSLALVMVALLAFPLTGEARVLPPLVIGCTVSAGWVIRSLASQVSPYRATSAALAVALATVAVAWPSTDRKAQIAFDYYKVLDPSMVHAAQYLDSVPGSGKAAVRTDLRGWPVGWWFRGLTGRPVLVGSDARWLGFPKERTQAEAVNELFAVTASAEAVRQSALDQGIAMLVFRPRDWAGWRDWSFGDGEPLSVVYDDGEYMILAVRGAP